MGGVSAPIERELRRIEEDALFSAKRHFNAQGFWNLVHYGIGIPTVVLAAVAGATASTHHESAASLTALTAAVLAGLSTFLNPNKRAVEHGQVGNRYLSLRNRSRIVREIDLIAETDEKALVTRTKELAAERDKLNQESPTTPRLAFVMARRGIEGGEADYAVDHRSNQGREPEK